MTLGDDGTQIIVYNGEVYNFKELKNCIKDVQFKSATDTEVILGLYKQLGLDFSRLKRNVRSCNLRQDEETYCVG